MILLDQAIKRYITTNLAQPHSEWVRNTVYKLNDEVLYDNHIYRTVVDNNQGVQPDLNTGKWLLFGVDNAYASIDLHSKTKTVIDEGLPFIELNFTTEQFTHLAFGGVQGATLKVTEKDTKGVVIKTKDYTLGVSRIDAVNWYDYFYLPIPDTSGTGSGLPVDILLDAISPKVATITVKLMPNGKGEAFISSMIGGKGINLGDTEYGLSVGLVDYSKKVTDEYGITTLERRNVRETMECDIVIPAKQAQGAKRVVKNSLGRALMFIADPETDSNFDNLIILGYIDDYTTYYNNGVISRSSIEIEEVL